MTRLQVFRRESHSRDAPCRGGGAFRSGGIDRNEAGAQRLEAGQDVVDHEAEVCAHMPEQVDERHSIQMSHRMVADDYDGTVRKDLREVCDSFFPAKAVNRIAKPRPFHHSPGQFRPLEMAQSIVFPLHVGNAQRLQQEGCERAPGPAPEERGHLFQLGEGKKFHRRE